MNTVGFEDLSIADYGAIIRRRWVWAVIPLLLVLLASVVAAMLVAPVYTSTSRVLVADTAAQESVGVSSPNTGVLDRSLENEISLAESDEVVADVIDQTGREPEGTIEAAEASDVLVFTFDGSSPNAAAEMATAYAEAYVDTKQSEAAASLTSAIEDLQAELVELQAQRDLVRTDLLALEDRLARATESLRATLQLQVDREASAIEGQVNLIDSQINANISSITELQLSRNLAREGTARIVQRAIAPDSPSNAPLSRNLLFGTVIGLIAGIGLALLRDMTDQSIRTAGDVERLDLPVLGEIPAPGKALAGVELGLAVAEHPGTAVADGCHKVQSAVNFSLMDVKSPIVLVTSPNQSEGKTTTSANLASAAAAAGQKVVLIDADQRRPRVNQVFGTPLIPGLTDAIAASSDSGAVIPREAIVADARYPDNLIIIPAGTHVPNPAGLLASRLFRKALTAAAADASVVIVDAPPVLAVADALAIAPVADGVVLVAKAGETKRTELMEAAHSIERSGGSLLGVVLTGTEETERYHNYRVLEVDEGPASAPEVVSGDLLSGPKPSSVVAVVRNAETNSKANRSTASAAKIGD